MLMALPPALVIPAATSSQGPALRLEITTLAPASAICSAIARPMPREDPVTIAVLPVRSNSSMSASAERWWCFARPYRRRPRSVISRERPPLDRLDGRAPKALLVPRYRGDLADRLGTTLNPPQKQ